MKKALLTFLSWFAFAVAGHADDDILYRSKVIVTGDREETRVPAIPQGFELPASTPSSSTG
ncbi:hypothetical protein [Mesorhizobium sp. SARCC-RB16n]|uniref:hypothetical protein n=1 Tax=Mesorhizobium sp. SARCC-RB16n TaxID=2116687 RepID=UPI00122F30D6|nr:hypothetical protein [Mesorhizobium sp. SARCC-RB16n]